MKDDLRAQPRHYFLKKKILLVIDTYRQLANIPEAAAITNAVANAIGARIYACSQNPNASTSR